MVRTLLADGLARPPAYVDGVDGAEGAGRAVHPRARRAGQRGRRRRHPPTRPRALRGRRRRRYGRVGVSTTGFGTLSHWAIGCLNLLAGHFDRPGGVLFPEPAVDAGRPRVRRARVTSTATAAGCAACPEYGGELPAAVMREEIETPGEGQIRAFVTIAGNPVLSTPDGRRLGEALDSLDFMVAIDIYLNETTRHADVILPPTTALERDHYDLVFHGLAVRNTARFSPAVFAKPDERPARLGDLPRAHRAPRARGSTGRRRARSGWCGAPGCATSPTRQLALLLRTGRRRRRSARAARAPRGRRPRPAAPDHARAAADRRTTASTWCPRCSSTTSTGCAPGSPTGPPTRWC